MIDDNRHKPEGVVMEMNYSNDVSQARGKGTTTGYFISFPGVESTLLLLLSKGPREVSNFRHGGGPTHDRHSQKGQPA